MNTFTKLSAKTLMQLLATAMITLTLFSCGGGDDTTTPPVTTTISANAAKVSMLSALATGEENEVNIYWSEVAGATSYKLYQSTTTLSDYQNASPTNLSTSSTVTVTTLATNTTNITLNGTQAFYFLVTAIKNTVESYTNATQTAATAFAMPFLTVVSTGTGIFNNITPTYRVWMDRNLGASQVATSSTDTLAYGDLYQWGRSADGHQASTTTIASTTMRVDSITPTHGKFIAIIDESVDWIADGVDDDGTLRSAYWARIDGSSICPTGFRVPTIDELDNEVNSWSSLNYIGAYASNLKLPVAGNRFGSTGGLNDNNAGNLWSMTPSILYRSKYMLFNMTIVFRDTTSRTSGFSVRCIKPE